MVAKPNLTDIRRTDNFKRSAGAHFLHDAPPRWHLSSLYGIERVFQDDLTGCGLACVAMIAGVSYREVRKIAIDHGIFYSGNDSGVSAEDVKKLLKLFDLDTSIRNGITDWKRVPQVGVLGINDSRPHWVVAVRTREDCFLIDPSSHINQKRRRDFGRISLIGDAVVVAKGNGFRPEPQRELFLPPVGFRSADSYRQYRWAWGL